MKKNEKEIYVTPAIVVVAMESNSLMAISGTGSDFNWGAPKRNFDLDEDEDEEEFEQKVGFSLIKKHE